MENIKVRTDIEIGLNGIEELILTNLVNDVGKAILLNNITRSKLIAWKIRRL